ncbi:MAG: hypothetical protein CMJ32_05410 [Phycisphaerae bacterium]|nr:hypothetical protein [Phycisphaerae bacterium]
MSTQTARTGPMLEQELDVQKLVDKVDALMEDLHRMDDSTSTATRRVEGGIEQDSGGSDDSWNSRTSPVMIDVSEGSVLPWSSDAIDRGPRTQVDGLIEDMVHMPLMDRTTTFDYETNDMEDLVEEPFLLTFWRPVLEPLSIPIRIMPERMRGFVSTLAVTTALWVPVVWGYLLMMRVLG